METVDGGRTGFPGCRSGGWQTAREPFDRLTCACGAGAGRAGVSRMLEWRAEGCVGQVSDLSAQVKDLRHARADIRLFVVKHSWTVLAADRQTVHE